MTIVVSPLISLIQDQVTQLIRDYKILAAHLASNMLESEKNKLFLGAARVDALLAPS